MSASRVQSESHRCRSPLPQTASWSRRLPRERKISGSNPACAGIFSGSSHTSDLKIDTLVAALPGAWWYRVSAVTGWPGGSILWLGEMEIWSATSISVWQDVKLSDQIRPWDTLACCCDVKQPTNEIPLPPVVQTNDLEMGSLVATVCLTWQGQCWEWFACSYYTMGEIASFVFNIHHSTAGRQFVGLLAYPSPLNAPRNSWPAQ